MEITELPDRTSSNFPFVLKAIRKSLQMSTADFATFSGISRSVIVRFENPLLGDHLKPGMKAWNKINQSLNEIEYFTTEDKSELSPPAWKLIVLAPHLTIPDNGIKTHWQPIKHTIEK